VGALKLNRTKEESKKRGAVAKVDVVKRSGDGRRWGKTVFSTNQGERYGPHSKGLTRHKKEGVHSWNQVSPSEGAFS